MFIEQLSIFLENRPGKLKGVADALKENQINIISLGLRYYGLWNRQDDRV